MTGIYWDSCGENKVRLKTYSATTKPSGETIFRVEIATTDAYEVAYLLRQFAELTTKQKSEQSARQKSRGRARQSDAPASGITADQRPLQLTYQGHEP